MALTMVGTQTPQNLFSGFAESVKNIPGTVTPEITAAMPSMADLEGILDAQNKQKALSAAAWARAAAMNNARVAQSNYQPQHDLPGTASQSSGMGAQYQGTAGGGSPSMMWAPRDLAGPKLGTWASQQQNRAVAENREIPMIMQAHTGDPFSPGETQGGSMAPQSSKGLFGPGLTRPIGISNPALWAMWAGKRPGAENAAQAQARPV